MSPMLIRRTLVAVFLLCILVPLISSSQVRIKERVEIQPKTTQKVKINSPLLQSSGRFFAPPLFVDGLLSLPARLTLSAALDIPVELGYNQQAYVQGPNFRLAWKTRSSAASGGFIEAGQSTYTGIFDKGRKPDIGLVLYDNSGWGSGTRTITTSNGNLEYRFEGSLYYPDVHVSATALATGSIIGDYLFDHWYVSSGDLPVTGLDSITIHYGPLDGTVLVYAPGDTIFGYPYEPVGIGPNEGEVTLSVEAKGDYAYLSYYETYYDATGAITYGPYQSGKELKVPYGYLWDPADPYSWDKGKFNLVYDDSHGTFGGVTDTVLVTISGGGKSKTIPVVLTKDYTCAQVTFDPPQLAPGDTATLSFKTEYGYDFEASQQFDVWIEEEGDSVGTLLSPTQRGKILTKVEGPVLYIAPSSIDSTMKFHVGAFAYGIVGGSNESGAPVGVVPVLKKGRPPVAMQSASKAIPRKTVAELNRRFALSACGLPGEVEIVNAQVTLRLYIPGTKEIWPTLPGSFYGGMNVGRNNVQQGISIKATRNNEPVPNHMVSIFVTHIDGTGGHFHSPAPTFDLMGTLKDVVTGNSSEGLIDCVTNGDGEIRLEYSAPEFSGRIAFSAKSLVGNAAVNDQLTVRVPDLVAFPETGNFSLTGFQSGHPKNHYMINQEAVQNLSSAADVFIRQKWNTTGKMKLNDMSLEWGGLFDVEVKEVAPHWTTPHKSHRIGRSVDIENIGLKIMTVKSRYTGLDTVVTVPSLPIVQNLVDFMVVALGNWDFDPEHQLEGDPLDRKSYFAHFEWKGM